MIGSAEKFDLEGSPEIWGHKRTARPVRLRGAPESIRPGDVILMPSSKADAKVIRERREAAQAAAAECDQLAARCEALATGRDRAVGQNTAFLKDNDAGCGAISTNSPSVRV